ncbi:MAG TPA: bile acid:sodium symporter [Paenalcaligenes sp.]|nr:bile acid:sodium symporter [Paenalcaligenes sp.]
MALLGWLNRHLSLGIPAFLISGFIFGLIFDAQFLLHAIAPLTLIMIYPMMVSVRAREIFSTGSGLVQGWAIGINFLLIPLIAYALGLLFFPGEPTLALGLLLAALLPTSGMTISWTGFASGNIPAAIKITVIGLFLGSILTPFYVQFLLGAHISVQLGLVFKQILLFIALPLVAGQLTRFWLLKKYGAETFRKEIAPKFPRFSTLGVLGIVFVAMALKAQDLVESPAFLLQIIVATVVLYLLNYLISTIVARRFLNYADGVALVFGTVMRNLSIALALAMTAFGSAGTQAAILIAIAYIIQVQSAAWYVRFSSRFLPA